jgi:VanZ family protein
VRGGRRLTLPKLLFWLAALFTFVMALLPQPPKIPGNPSDKVQHAVAFAVLGLLAAWAYPGASPLLLIAALSGFGLLIEIFHLVPVLGRDSDLVDWIVDTVAAGLVIAVVSWWRTL